MKSYNVLILGNGILGLSTAFALAQEDPTLQIGIIGPSNQLGNATIAAGAMLGCFGEVTQASFNSEYGLAKLDMAVKAGKIWPEWLNIINNLVCKEKRITIQPGTFIILNAKSGKLDNQNYSAITKALNLYSEPHQEVDPLDIPGINPREDCRPLRSLYLPNENSINAIHLLNNLQEVITQNKNISIINGMVRKVHTADGKIKWVQTEDNTSIQAESVVLATGAYSQALIEQIPELKFQIPKILASRGYALLLNSKSNKFKGVIRTPNRAGACGIHAISRGNSSLYLGASNYLGLTPETKPKIRYVYYLLQYVMEQISQDFQDAELSDLYIGNRPVTVDSFPLIGSTSIKGLWILTGTYRDGLHNSPLLAQSIAKEILGKKATFSNKFLPERLPIRTMTKEQAIEEFVNHSIASAYEHSIDLPKNNLGNILQEMIYERTVTIYKKLNINFGLPPELLLMIDRGGEEYISFFRNYYQSLQEKFIFSKNDFKNTSNYHQPHKDSNKQSIESV